MIATELPKCLRKFADKIESVSDERGSDDGFWVYLIERWRDDEGETHCIHEDNPKECATLMPHIQRCTDPNCCNQPDGLKITH